MDHSISQQAIPRAGFQTCSDGQTALRDEVDVLVKFGRQAVAYGQMCWTLRQDRPSVQCL